MEGADAIVCHKEFRVDTQNIAGTISNDTTRVQHLLKSIQIQDGAILLLKLPFWPMR